MPCLSKLRPWTYHCLFGLLSVSGLRLGEARSLKLQDLDLKAAVLTIRSSKFGKCRLVPLHASTCKVLADYIARRKRHWARRPVSSYLFVSSWGNRLDGGEIHRTTPDAAAPGECSHDQFLSRYLSSISEVRSAVAA